MSDACSRRCGSICGKSPTPKLHLHSSWDRVLFKPALVSNCCAACRADPRPQFNGSKTPRSSASPTRTIQSNTAAACARWRSTHAPWATPAITSAAPRTPWALTRQALISWLKVFNKRKFFFWKINSFFQFWFMKECKYVKPKMLLIEETHMHSSSHFSSSSSSSTSTYSSSSSSSTSASSTSTSFITSSSKSKY